MIPLFVLGINHDSASIEVRERVAFAPELISTALSSVVRDTRAVESAIMSTCNRTELYLVVADDVDTSVILEELLLWLANYHDLDVMTLRDCHYHYSSDQAVRHMMCVASGLNSLVLGEPQILGQMKSSYAVAQNADTLASELHSVFQKVFAVAKRVRTQTAIGENPVSVAYAAVTLAQQIFSDISAETALLIGAGETIDLVAQHLRRRGIKNMIFANRTLARAQELADTFSAQAVLLSDIPEQLVHADIVISSTASQLPILGKGAVESALKQRRHKPIFMVDIAVPRDIEKEVGDLDDVYLYTVDDLRDVIDENKQSRENAATEAQGIIDECLVNYMQETRARHSVSAIKHYRQHAETLRDESLDKALRDLHNGIAADEVIKQMANSLTNKLLHVPTKQLKKASTGNNKALLSLTKKLFAVDSHFNSAINNEDNNENSNEDKSVEINKNDIVNKSVNKSVNKNVNK
ncbi:MAG: glutamyl-tRNA reductase [Candidatus Endobugula sp.]|jgi:glutamyl-tRNA reductase